MTAEDNNELMDGVRDIQYKNNSSREMIYDEISGEFRMKESGEQTPSGAVDIKFANSGFAAALGL